MSTGSAGDVVTRWSPAIARLRCVCAIMHGVAHGEFASADALRLMQALIQVVQQKLLSALAQEEAINHAEITRLVHAVAELGRVSFAHQRWTAEVRRRKKERRRREEDALITSDLQQILLDPHDDIPELDAELAQFTMDETQVPADEQEPADLNALPSRPSPSMKTDSFTQPSKFVSGPRYIGFTAALRR